MMNAMLLAIEAMLAVGLLVCLVLFIQLKHELHRLRTSLAGKTSAGGTTEGEPDGHRTGVAIRIPIDRLPPRPAPARVENSGVRGIRAEPPAPKERPDEGEVVRPLTSEEERLRRRVQSLKDRSSPA